MNANRLAGLQTAFMESTKARQAKGGHEFQQLEPLPSRMALLENSSLKQGPHTTVHFENGDWYLGTWKDDKKDGNGTYYSAATEGLYEGEWVDDLHCGWGTYSEPIPSKQQSLQRQIDEIEKGPQKHPKLQSLSHNGQLISQNTKLLLSLHSNVLSGLSVGGAPAKKSSALPNKKKTSYRPLRKCYAGQWKDGQFNGMGTYYYPDGSSYEGEWEDGKRQGWGKMRYIDHSVYTGQWDHDQRHGEGELVLENGDRYEGSWMNDKKEGPGKFIYRTKRHVYQGEWTADQPRCGTIKDLPPLTNQPPKKRGLPILELRQPEELLQRERELIIQERMEQNTLSSL